MCLTPVLTEEPVKILAKNLGTSAFAINITRVSGAKSGQVTYNENKVFEKCIITLSVILSKSLFSRTYDNLK